MFPIAEFLKPITWNTLQDVDAHRQIIFEAIVKYRKMKNQGVVAVFKRDRFDRYSNFARIGEGSLGGKGRGLAFIDNLVKRHPEFEEFDNARVAIPKTVVLCTDGQAARPPGRGLLHLLRRGEVAHRHPFVVAARRLSLPALCRHLQYVHDSLPGRQV